MKTKLLITVLCVLVLQLSTTAPAYASGSTDAASVAVDVLVARPISFAMTVVGSALFVVSLPFSAGSGYVDKAAHTLVTAPAKDTFTRPLGDFDEFMDE